tara:strand:- start:12652 stop:13449 length:798 start_codon:yes stop_codon:yes gene_type:complete
VDIDMEGAVDALIADDVPVVDTPVDDTPIVEQVVEESFTGLDPTSLPEDLQLYYKNMQADYTRKTQEIAEQRKQYQQLTESGIDPSYALEAVGFLQRLDDDPAFAADVARQLAPQQESPMTVQQPSEDSIPNDSGDYANLSPDLQAELQAMREFRSSFNEQQREQEMLSELQFEEQQIRAQYPHYNDTDIENIYQVAHATDGNLLAAQEVYTSMEQSILNKYLQSKQIPQGITSPSGGPASIPGASFASIDDAHKAAMEKLRNLQ